MDPVAAVALGARRALAASPGCTRKWPAAWPSAWSGSSWRRRPGPTGSRCAAAWTSRPRRRSAIRRRAACGRTAGTRQDAARAATARPWWQALERPAAPRSWPVPEGSVQMLWANMALHFAADPQALLAQWHRALAPEGFLMLLCFGPDTVRELHALYAALGWPPPGPQFTDMHDWGDMLVHGGFAEPVMDMERHHAQLGIAGAAAGRTARAGRQPASRPLSRRCAGAAGARGWSRPWTIGCAVPTAAGADLRDRLRPRAQAAPRVKDERSQRGVAAGHAGHAAS
jgi:SAM-dependent methyltransferase